MADHASILAWEEFHGWRSLVGYSPWDRKELDTTGRQRERALPGDSEGLEK